MKFLCMHKWDEYQHYHDGRRPTWIKFYVDLLNPSMHEAYTAMSDGAKLTLHHLWLLAAECNGRVPIQWLTKARLNMQTKPKIDEVISAGYASYSSGPNSVSTSPRASVSLSTSSSASKNLDSWQELEFEKIWKEYPRAIGKKGAWRHFRASVRTPEDLAAMRDALASYIISQEVQRGYIKHGSTWFNDWRDYIPKAQIQKRYPVTPDDVRELESRLKNEWYHEWATEEQGRTWVKLAYDEYRERLSEMPTLAELFKREYGQVQS